MLGEINDQCAVAFGAVLRELRKKAGLSQEALGFAADLQRNYISLMELGHNQPSVATVFKLANALNVRPSVMMEMLEQRLSS